jgi:hypothetical protein
VSLQEDLQGAVKWQHFKLKVLACCTKLECGSGLCGCCPYLLTKHGCFSGQNGAARRAGHGQEGWLLAGRMECCRRTCKAALWQQASMGVAGAVLVQCMLKEAACLMMATLSVQWAGAKWQPTAFVENPVGAYISKAWGFICGLAGECRKAKREAWLLESQGELKVS